jgi:hypothetical protein
MVTVVSSDDSVLIIGRNHMLQIKFVLVILIV